MVKIVIAGTADCSAYAACEVLAESLQQNLPNFHLTKIVLASDEWNTFSENLAKDRGWPKMASPIIWRELVDTGGRAKLIGGANDFQEYTIAYYDQCSNVSTHDLLQITSDNQRFLDAISASEAMKRVMRCYWRKITIIGAESSTAARLTLLLALMKHSTLTSKIKLSLFPGEIENCQTVEALKCDLEEAACTGIHKIEVFSDLTDAIAGASFIVILDVVPRKPLVLVDGIPTAENRAEWLKRRYNYLYSLGKKICKHADQNVRVLVAGSVQIFEGSEITASPLNFDVQTLHNACKGSIDLSMIVGLPRALEYFVKGALARYLGVNRCDIVDLILWGNIDNTFLVDLSQTRVYRRHGRLDSETGPTWFSIKAQSVLFKPEEFYSTILPEKFQKMKSSAVHASAMCHASAIFDFIKRWQFGQSDPKEIISSLVVSSNGQYGVPLGVAFSLPVTFTSMGSFEICQGIPMDQGKADYIVRCVFDVLRDWSVIDPSMLTEFQKHLDLMGTGIFGDISIIPEDEIQHVINPVRKKLKSKADQL
ncbi:hypothetical protein Aperf_G00000039564 [Anoplocephala perfoliata]